MSKSGGYFCHLLKMVIFCTYISYNPDVPKCKRADFMLSIYPPGLNTGLFHRHMLECPGAGDVSPESGGHPRAGVSMLGTRYNLGISSVYPRCPQLQSPVSSGPPLIRQPADNPQQVLVRSVPASLINNTGNWVPSDYGRFFPAHVIGVLSISIHIPFTFYCSWFINDNLPTKPLQLFCLDMLGNYSKPIVS